MMLEVKVPSVGESITEGLLVEWLRQDGEAVRTDDHLFVLETDKVTMTVDSPGAGRLKILVAAGEAVRVGQAVAAIDTEAAGAGVPFPVEEAGWQKLLPAQVPPEPVPQAPAPPMHPPAGPAQAEAKVEAMSASGELSPAVRRMIEEFKLDASAIRGTGKDGRITKEDVLRHQEERNRETEKQGDREGKGLDMGPGALGQSWGQFVQTQQFMQSLREGTAFGPPPAPVPPAPPPVAPAAAERRTRTPLSPLRQRIAERMILSQQSTATLTTFAEADMSAVVAIRGMFKEPFKEKHGVSLGFMSFFVKAVVNGLRAVPALMSTIDGGDLVQSQACDIGIAVSTERGLVVPVLRDADRMTFAEIEKGIAELAKRARERTITLAELEGGAFTITNAGSYGALFGTPILNPPQSGILGTYAIKEQPVAVGGQVAVRPMMMLALSYDHRVVDGEAAGRFLQRVTAVLEHPAALLLEI